jgi:hypothetical protein
MVTEFDDATSFIGDPPPMPDFDPLLAGGHYYSAIRPWHATTPERIRLNLTAGATSRVDFGGYPFDQSVVSGRAILEDNYAAPGTPVEAFAGGQQCGATTIESPYGVFTLMIVGAGEREGCPLPGETVTFRVGGIDAAETVVYTPNTDALFRFVWRNLTAMPNYAWYWAQEPGDKLPPAGTRIQATVGGIPCGEAVIETRRSVSGNPVSGFSKLIVPASSVRAGCGGPGVPVDFVVDGRTVGRVVWAPGIQRVTLQTPLEPAPSPSPSPTGTPPVDLPRGGGPPQGRTAAGQALIALGAAALLAPSIPVWLLGRRRR